MKDVREIRDCLGAIAALIVVCVGCPAKQSGPPTAQLAGAVTLNGGSIPADAGATILFEPVQLGDSHPAQATIENGKYEVDAAPVGKVRVTISITQPTGKVLGTEGRQSMEMKNLVPESLRNGQEIQVDGDKSDLNFDIK